MDNFNWNAEAEFKQKIAELEADKKHLTSEFARVMSLAIDRAHSITLLEATNNHLRDLIEKAWDDGRDYGNIEVKESRSGLPKPMVQKLQFLYNNGLQVPPPSYRSLNDLEVL